MLLTTTKMDGDIFCDLEKDFDSVNRVSYYENWSSMA
jgi:hypothetical protein